MIFVSAVNSLLNFQALLLLLHLLLLFITARLLLDDAVNAMDTVVIFRPGVIIKQVVYAVLVTPWFHPILFIFVQLLDDYCSEILRDIFTLIEVFFNHLFDLAWWHFEKQHFMLNLHYFVLNYVHHLLPHFLRLEERWVLHTLF